MTSRLRIGPFVHNQGDESPSPSRKKKSAGDGGHEKSHSNPPPLGTKGVVNLGRGDKSSLFRYDAREVEHYGLTAGASDSLAPAQSYLTHHPRPHVQSHLDDTPGEPGARAPPSMGFLHRVLDVHRNNNNQAAAQAEEEGEPVASESHSGEEGATPMEAASPSVSPTAHSPMGGQWGAQGAAGPGAVVAQSAGAFAPQLRTGEDAINFFAQYGSHTPIKFVHLVRALGDEAVVYRPYDLLIVNPRDTGHDYYTMSAAGLVHIAPGESSEVIPLSEWLRFSTLFNVLRNIRFYKYYLHTKAFTLWKNNVRFKLYCQQRRRLASRLFLAKESFCAPLMELKKHLVEIQDVKLLDLSLKTFEPQQFVECQSNRRNDAAKQFESILERVSTTLQRACTEVANLSHAVEHKEDVFEGVAGATKGVSKTRSIVAIKQEQAQKKQMLHRAEQEAARLPDFIRLIDYIGVECLVDLVISSNHDFLHELLKPRKAGLFETIVKFNDESTGFAPTCEQLQSIIASMFEGMISTVNGVNRVLYLKIFHDRLANVVRNGPVVSVIIRASRKFQNIARDIDEKIEGDFKEAEEYAVVFDSVRPIYDTHRTWNLDEFRRVEHSSQALKEYLDTYSGWERDVEKMRARQPCGILEVESRKLKSLLLPMIAEKMEAVKTLIRDVARTKCREQSSKYKARIAKLSQRPMNLKDFASQVQVMEELKTQDKTLHKNTQVVEQMYSLLWAYKVAIPTEDMVSLEDLKNLQQQYTIDTEASKTFKDERLPEMTQQLDINIARLNDQLMQIKNTLEEGVFIDAQFFMDPVMILGELEVMADKLNALSNLARTYAEYQELFNIESYAFKTLTKAQETFERQNSLWKMILKWNEQTEHWMADDFTKVDVEEMNKDVGVYFKDAFALHKKMNNDVTAKLKDAVADLKAKMNVVLELGNPSMRPRHWEKLFKILNQSWFPDQKFSLTDLLNFGILKYPDVISETSAAASGEAGLEESLAKIAKGWDTAEFTVLNHREQADVFILGGLDEVFTLLEDNQVALQTMMGSRFIAGVQQAVEHWEKKLSLLSETLDEWITTQRNWMYLETIFCAEDIQKQLPVEALRFMNVDKFWKATLKRTKENPKVIWCIEDGPLLLSQFQSSNVALEEIQKSLEDYLETKRGAFPRFYFLSNDELLEILSQTRDPHAVQPHMQKCFDAIKKLRFGEGRQSLEIYGFEDPGGEYVVYTEPKRAEGPVEDWLTNVEKGMRTALYDQSRAAVLAYPPHGEQAINRATWMWSFPAQVVIVVDQIFWTRALGAAILSLEKGESTTATQDFLDFSLKQIDAMVVLVRSNLTRGQRTLLGALITIDVHARDVVRVMVQKRVASSIDFEWTRQLRYYWDADVDNVVARQTNTRFIYGFEYLGNGPRLVITPLTDICYMTLTGALHMRLGGAPAGPAGTGKTETTKDLAKALAVYCVVFNCSDGLDYKIMGRFFSGLAQQGAWACFDEFNRIDIEVLSVIAQQVLCIQQAIIQNAKEFDFEGKVIPLNTSFGVFITMNPGYAGRTELPDNLKALFRPVAMMVPDYRLIAEIVLFSEGFANALPLSNKMAQLYSLSSEQLSKQDHYDFGMRAVKSVLVAAGQLKRKEPETNEDLLLIRAMRDSNVPKFLEHDLPLFQGILSDLFPGVTVPYVDYGRLQTAIETELIKEQYQPVPSFITKVIQVHETQLVRHGMMVVGEAGSGKSANVMILARALSTLHAEGVVDRDGFFKVVDRLVLNPKSITAGELYGEFNLMTNEWADGLVPKLVRQCVQCVTEGSDNRKWVVFDGPVDAVWIENMNTVLDDNKTLCLANSERIKLPSTLHMMFEVQDLKVASPATVSRCGMVYMEQIHIGMLSLVKSWGSVVLSTLLPPEPAGLLLKLLSEHVEAAVAFVREHCKMVISATNHNLVQSLCNLLQCLLDPARGFDAAHPNLPKILKLQFLFAVVWSLGANIHDKSRPAFQEWMRNRFGYLVEGEDEIFLTDVYGYTVDGSKGAWSSWLSLLTDFSFDRRTPYFNLLVPTAETTKYSFLLDKLMRSGFNVLYMGETGVGKSVVVQSFLDQMTAGDQSAFVSYTMGYSAQTKPRNLKDVLEAKLEKKRKNLLGPPAGKKMLFFIDDLNMPALEVYGAQPPNELLRQIIDQQGFYDTQKLFFKNVKDVVFASCCAPPGGGRNEVSPRLLRQFSMIWLTNLSSESMIRIFASILRGFLGAEIPALAQFAEPIVKASVDIYERVESELLPTPTKSHYTFNLRDLSKVFQGVLMTKAGFTTSMDDLVKLWCHEESRVFRDRLINEGDRDYFNGLLRDMIAKHMATDLLVSEFKELIYGDYLTREDKVYRQVASPAVMTELLMEYLEEYNITFPSQMHLVFFNDALHHISRICRVLRQPRGNALLVGVGGSGRQSLTRLAAFMADYKCKSIEIKRGYGVNEFHEDLKGVLMSAGAENLQTVFLFSDSQIVTESFLEDINNILNSGEVPNLYASDELEKIVNMVRPLAKAAGKMETREVILQHYLQLVRENLHVVLAMSPIGAGFRTRCRMFPSLVNCCTIDWFDAWPEDALYSVAHRLLNERPDLGIGAHIAPLCKVAVNVHRTVERQTERYLRELKRYNYTTPTSYLELIRLYLDILGRQREVVSGNEGRYRGGLQKLADTEKVVADLQERLTEMKPFLEKAAKETAELLIKVEADQSEAEAVQQVVAKDVTEANKVAAEVQVIKDDCQADLDEAMPAYKQSIKALDSLDKKSIQEMKAFNNPPEMVAVCIEAVCILLGSKPSWDEGKKLLSAMNFMDRLRDYDKDNISKKAIKDLQKYMANPKFVPDEVKKVSEAATCLCMWVRAMVTYDRVAKNIEPKKAKLAEAEAELAKTNEQLAKKKASLQEVLDRVAALKATLQATMTRKAELEAQAQRTVLQLSRADKLIGGLGGEKLRWQAAAEKLGKDMVNLVGNMMLSAGVVAYLGPFTAEFRRSMVKEWISLCRDTKIPVDADFTLQATLGNPVTIRQWQICGLPADEFSTENGIITTMGRRWPLMIDPQGQANRWVRNTFADKNLQVIKLSDKDFLRTLENGIRYGAPVLLENVGEELDPSLEPVLLKQVFKRGGQLLLRLGDSDVPYSDEFRFFITTKLANPHYMPEVCIKVTTINFTVTMSGLEDQLLVDVIKNERPDLEDKKDALVVSIASDQKALKDLENKILHMLANASGNILDDEELIETLAQSKVTSTAISGRLTEAEATTKLINETRESYRVVATRGSVIYFVIANLALVDPMYQYSLRFYKDLFTLRLKKSEKSDDVSKRLKLLLEDVTLFMYTNVCRGLFEKDKLLYAFMMAANIHRQAGTVSEKEWRCYLVGPGVADAPTLKKHTAPPKAATWLTGKVWNDVIMLEESMPEAFTGLVHDCATHHSKWEKIILSATPYNEELPGQWHRKLTSFQKLLILRVLREEKLVFGTRKFVKLELGETFSESPPFNLEAAYQDSSNLTPLIFVLSPGADINDYLLELAKNKGKLASGGLKIISLGQGQGPIAERLMQQGRSLGDWVCLQNCHLAASWLPRLEQNLEQAGNNADAIHPEFRLWLTSMPSSKFPVPILQTGIKITNEPPKGLRANLLRTFLDLKEEEFESCTRPRAFKKLLFSVAFFNALILERRKFGAVGWNIPYEWMNSDLKAAIMQVRMYVEEQEAIPWDTLNVMVADITYGGRVTDKQDKRSIGSIMRKYFDPQVMDDSYRFSESGLYFAPAEGNLEALREYVRSLPIEDPPETFGLHPNADITFQQKETNNMLETIILIAGGGGGGGGGGGNADAQVSEMAAAIDRRMPAPFDVRKAHPETFKRVYGSMNSLGVFLGQEFVRFNGLIEVMKATLNDLQRAIKGIVVMSGPLENMYNCFLFNRVPPAWENAGYPCLKPLASWIEDFFARITFMQDWLLNGPRPSYWLSGFFFPQGFMTAVKQTYSRDYKIAIDTLVVGCEMMSFDLQGIKSLPKDGVYVHGLFMEGARFDRSEMTVAEALPGVLFDATPCIWFKPEKMDEASSQEGSKLVYSCPLYKTSRRAGTLSTTGHSTNFVVALDIPTKKEPDHWIRRGCAMLCMLDT